MNRKKGIIAAGTFTGLILLTILALGFGSLQTSSADSEADSSAADISPPATDNVNAEQALQQWQTYGAELEQTVRTLQERDLAYQQQLEQANQTITTLQNEINANNSAPANQQYKEHERAEHESYEFGERDD